jgi:hypothetical protein
MKRIHLSAVAALIAVVMMVPGSLGQAYPLDFAASLIPVFIPDDGVVCVSPAEEEAFCWPGV